MMLASHLVRNISKKFLISPGSHNGLSVLQKFGLSDGKQIIHQQICRISTDSMRCPLNYTTTRYSALLSKKLPRMFQSCLYSCIVRVGPNRLVFLQAKLALPPSLRNSIRQISAESNKTSHNSIMLYVFSTVIFMIGMSYAGVPLYRIFCQVNSIYNLIA